MAAEASHRGAQGRGGKPLLRESDHGTSCLRAKDGRGLHPIRPRRRQGVSTALALSREVLKRDGEPAATASGFARPQVLLGRTVADVLGHADVSTTLCTYVHSTEGATRRAA